MQVEESADQLDRVVSSGRKISEEARCSWLFLRHGQVLQDNQEFCTEKNHSVFNQRCNPKKVHTIHCDQPRFSDNGPLNITQKL